MQVKIFFPFIFFILFQGCASHFFQPDQRVYRTPKYYELEYDDVYFDSYDKTPLHAWHIYPRTQSKGLVFVAHGNAQNLSAHFVGWTWLVEAGYEVFIFDYRGYGKSQGESSIKGSVEDTKAALNYVEKTYKKPYVAVGQSLGGTMLLNAVYTRDNKNIKALVIDSTFTGFPGIAKEKMDAIWLTWPFQWIPSLTLTSDYDAKDKIVDVETPLLFIHGSLDNIISVDASWNLFEKSSAPKEMWIVKNAGHIQGLENTIVQEDFLQYLNEGMKHYHPHYTSLKIYK